MKYLSILILFISSVCFAEHPDSWKNWYCPSFSGSGTESAKYAKQMGYEYISPVVWRGTAQYGNAESYKGLNFYLTDPWGWVMLHTYGYSRTIDTGGTTSASAIAWYNLNMAWGNATASFPYNLASGWWAGSIFNPHWDIQQQRVMDLVVDGIVQMAHNYAGDTFIFKGTVWDFPGGLTGDWRTATNTAVTLNYFTGTNSSLLHGTITHEYATYSEANAAFIQQLNTSLRSEFGDTKQIINPWVIYNSSSNAQGVYDEWIYQIKDRSDREEIKTDMILQESGHVTQYLNYANDTNIFTSGVDVTRDVVGNSQTDITDSYKDRQIAAYAAINGSWYNYFGRFANIFPDDLVVDVYPRLKLVRAVPNFCNLSDVGTSNCTWDGNTFSATKASIAGDMPFAWIGTSTMWVHKWGSARGYPFGVNETSDLYVVKHGTGTENIEPLQIDPDRIVYQVKRLNGYMEEDVDGKADWRRDGASGNYYLNEGLLIGTATDGGLPYKFKIAKPGMALIAYSED